MRQTLAPLLLAAITAGSAAACPPPVLDGQVEIYPTSEELPANLLRFFVYFPRSMGRGDILSHIALVDETGSQVDGAFLTNRYDLWSPDTTRLTVLLDPGRVKTGLVAHEMMGRALEEGQSYTLVIRQTAIDAQGCDLGSETTHRFIAGPPDLTPPAPNDWRLTRPEHGTRDPLVVDLGSPHDHLSLVYRLRVLDDQGERVAGRIDLGDGESVWRFSPGAPWADSMYRLAVDDRLEDLAGNRPGRLFDQPIGTAMADLPAHLDWFPITATR